jgi:hypothetical protein
LFAFAAELKKFVAMLASDSKPELSRRRGGGRRCSNGVGASAKDREQQRLGLKHNPALAAIEAPVELHQSATFRDLNVAINFK